MKENTWATIGKVATILTIVGFLLSVYPLFISPKKVKISAKGVLFDFNKARLTLKSNKNDEDATYSSSARIEITNTGDVEATDLTLYLPEIQGIYFLTKDDEIKGTSNFKDEIEFGALKPGSKIEIVSWLSERSFLWNLKDKSRLGFKEGSMKIDFASDVWGFWLGVMIFSISLNQ